MGAKKSGEQPKKQSKPEDQPKEKSNSDAEPGTAQPGSEETKESSTPVTSQQVDQLANVDGAPASGTEEAKVSNAAQRSDSGNQQVTAGTAAPGPKQAKKISVARDSDQLVTSPIVPAHGIKEVKGSSPMPISEDPGRKQETDSPQLSEGEKKNPEEEKKNQEEPQVAPEKQVKKSTPVSEEPQNAPEKKTESEEPVPSPAHGGQGENAESGGNEILVGQTEVDPVTLDNSKSPNRSDVLLPTENQANTENPVREESGEYQVSTIPELNPQTRANEASDSTQQNSTVVESQADSEATVNLRSEVESSSEDGNPQT